MLAVGAPLNDQGGVDAGQVVVYERNESSARWNQLGEAIVWQGFADNFGHVSLLNMGDVLGAGIPSDNTENGSDSGSVRLFRFDRDTASWDPWGQILGGQAKGDHFGSSVSVSSSGTIVAIGAPENDSGGFNAGQVLVFQFSSESSSWVPMGEAIDGQVGSGEFGHSVSLDASGLALAVGAPGTISVSAAERVVVFEFDNTTSTWIQRGQTLTFDDGFGNVGWSVSLSYDRNVLAVGIWGEVRIYQYDSGTREWNPVVENLTGNVATDRFGSSVSLSGDGTVVGSGTWRGDPNGVEDAGYVKVFHVELILFPFIASC